LTAKATCNGIITATGGENCTSRGFEWGLVQGGPYPNSWTEAGSFGTGAFSHQFTGLDENTLHYYRAKAYNSVGWGYGGEQSFTTWKAVSVSDTGAGTEATVPIEATLSVSDAGAGTEATVPIEASLTITETSTGVDVATAEGPGLVEVFDEGAGVDAIDVVAAIDIPESGAGAEAFSATAEQAASETAVGSDECAITGLITGAESGAGTDAALSVEAAVSVAESGAGTETQSVEASISSSESGVGVDAPGIQNQLTETDAGIGSESPGISVSVSVTETGTGADGQSVQYSIPVSDSAHGTEASVFPSASLTVADSAIGLEGVTTPGTLTVVDEGKGAEFAWRTKPSNPMIDALALPHVLSIRISDPAVMSNMKVQGGSLPRRKMVGKPGRTVEIEGWSDDQSEIDALDALRDGVRRTFYHPSGDSFGVLVTGFEPSRTVDQYNRRLYRLAVAEAN
jgi:hypothetical protein